MVSQGTLTMQGFSDELVLIVLSIVKIHAVMQESNAHVESRELRESPVHGCFST